MSGRPSNLTSEGIADLLARGIRGESFAAIAAATGCGTRQTALNIWNRHASELQRELRFQAGGRAGTRNAQPSNEDRTRPERHDPFAGMGRVFA